jgi:hypothetical protein
MSKVENHRMQKQSASLQFPKTRKMGWEIFLKKNKFIFLQIFTQQKID